MITWPPAAALFQHGIQFQVVGQFVEAGWVESCPETERSGLDHERTAGGGGRFLAQPRADRRVECLLEAGAGAVHGVAQHPLDVFVQSYCCPHRDIMMPECTAIKMLRLSE
ncbi:MAG: hypothetical protein M5U12_25420 [Verrucomicrobia bacterium]|nr:hypothetical protein [Verrucomicrobiota bacterium]